MHLFKTLSVLALTGAIWFGATQTAAAQTATAAPVDQQATLPDAAVTITDYGLVCAGDACTVEIPVELSALTKAGARFAIDIVQDNLKLLPAGGGIELSDALTVKLPVGDIKLTGADLTLSMADDGTIDQLRGTAELPFPGLGMFENMHLSGPVKADVGFAQGSDLTDLNAPLDPDRDYVFFNFGTGLDMTADHVRADGETTQLRLTVPKGQRATLVVDTQEPFAYLAGNLTLRYDEQLAFVGDWITAVDAAGLATDFASGLPIRHSVGVEWTSAIGENQPAFLRVGGSYAADAGLVGRWLGVNLTPLTLHGVMTLNGDGMLLDGVVRTEIMPETFFDGTVYTQVFVPFEGDLSDAYVQMDAEATVPAVHATMAGSARLEGDLDVRATASVTTPIYDNGELVLVEQDGDGARQRLTRVRSLADGAGNTMTRSYVFVRDTSAGGLNWVGDSAGSTWHWSQARWCGLTGFCGDDAIATAMAVE